MYFRVIGNLFVLLSVECTEFCSNFAHRIYLFELKSVRRITSSLGNELATVLITVGCIALLVRITLSEGKGTK